MYIYMIICNWNQNKLEHANNWRTCADYPQKINMVNIVGKQKRVVFIQCIYIFYCVVLPYSDQKHCSKVIW